MEGNFEDIIKKEFDREDEEIRRSIAEREDVDAEFAALQADDSMKQEFRQMLSERSSAASEDEELLAQMSEEGREAYRLGLELLKKREHRDRNRAAGAGNPKNPECSGIAISEDHSVEIAEDFTGEVVDKVRMMITEDTPLATAEDEFEEASKDRLGKKVIRFFVKKPYVAVVMVAVLTMGLGITSFGGKKYVMDIINEMLPGKEQTTLDSKDEEREYSDRENDEIYAKTDKELGIDAVRTVYLPEAYELEDVDIDSEADWAYISYTDEKEGWLHYFMYVNQADQSVSVYHDDEMLSQEQIILSDTLIDITKYKNADDSVYYEATFIYENVNYRLTSNTEKKEFEKIVKNLFFY